MNVKTKSLLNVLNFKRKENWIAVVISLFPLAIMIWFSNAETLENITDVLANLSIYIGAGLIGVLGFILSGLAIVTGTVSNKVAQSLYRQNRYDQLLKILFSFRYIGKVVVLGILVFFADYILIRSSAGVIWLLYYGLMVFSVYILSYVLVSIIDLLETSILLFDISMEYSKAAESEREVESMIYMTDIQEIQINTITKILIDRRILDFDDWMDALMVQIENDVKDDKQEVLKKLVLEYYGIIK